jgi:hypothetical protein
MADEVLFFSAQIDRIHAHLARGGFDQPFDHEKVASGRPAPR